MFGFDPIKKFIQDFRRSDVPHELKKRAYARSPSEMRKFKDKIAAARRRQKEKRDAVRSRAYLLRKERFFTRGEGEGKKSFAKL